MGVFEVLIVVVALGVVGYAASRFGFESVMEYERAVRYDAGRFTGVVGPGRFWVYHPKTRIARIDMRQHAASVQGQEVLTADRVPVKVSLVVRYAVKDPVKAVNEVADYMGDLHVESQLVLRKVMEEYEAEDLLGSREAAAARMRELMAPTEVRLGLSLDAVEIKDLMFSGALKQSFAEVLKARQEGLASLERARGETAALRSLANAARLLDSTPGMMQLRLLQVLEKGGGAAVIGVDEGGRLKVGTTSPTSEEPPAGPR